MSDRVLTGARSFAAAALMVAMVAGANALRMPAPNPDFWLPFAAWSAAICAAVGVVGFLAGSARLNRCLGFLWGGRKPSAIEFGVLTLIVLAIYAVVMFGWPGQG